MTTYTAELELPADCDLERAGETVTVEVPEDEYILRVARREGIWLPADCQQGWCTTCAGELLEGSVDQSRAKRYYEEDREANLVLLCVATPTSDLRVRVCQEEQMLEHRAAHDLPPGRSKR